MARPLPHPGEGPALRARASERRAFDAGGDHQPRLDGIVALTAPMGWELLAKPDRSNLHASGKVLMA